MEYQGFTEIIFFCVQVFKLSLTLNEYGIQARKELFRSITGIFFFSKRFDHKEIRQRKRRDAIDQTILRVPANDEIYIVNLSHARQILHSDAAVILTDSGVQQKVDAVDTDCYLVGDVTSHGGLASFSYCHGMVRIFISQFMRVHFTNI